ncbi:MAG: GIY-YIG nuclease family protein [Candidatus Lokiarchaeota archaeon]|nr:GIY-YIG nuclease family protein [Candidatus Lokiarchaeota archaeon]
MEIKEFYVYILECISSKGKKSFYTGYTKSLENRIQLHSEGKGAKYTRGKQIKLLFYQSFKNRSEAMKVERNLKKLSKKQKIELILSNKNLIKEENT